MVRTHPQGSSRCRGQSAVRRSSRRAPWKRTAASSVSGAMPPSLCGARATGAIWISRRSSRSRAAVAQTAATSGSVCAARAAKARARSPDALPSHASRSAVSAAPCFVMCAVRARWSVLAPGDTRVGPAGAIGVIERCGKVMWGPSFMKIRAVARDSHLAALPSAAPTLWHPCQRRRQAVAEAFSACVLLADCSVGGCVSPQDAARRRPVVLPAAPRAVRGLRRRDVRRQARSHPAV